MTSVRVLVRKQMTVDWLGILVTGYVILFGALWLSHPPTVASIDHALDRAGVTSLHLP